jgi:general secretion pathway protein J
MVIAIAIFAVIGAISHTTLTRFLETHERLEARNEKTRHLQNTISQFERDVRFMSRRPIRDGLGEMVPAFRVSDGGISAQGELMELTVTIPSYRNPEWHRLQRIDWVLRDGELIRRAWAVLDRDFDSQPREKRLLSNVRSAVLRTYGRDADSGRIRARDEWADLSELPLGVELLITLDDDVSYRRFVEVAGGRL